MVAELGLAMDPELLGQLALALVVAAFLGGLIGLEREARNRWAGLRTHMMVALGCCLFVVIGVTSTQAAPAELSRVIQGVAAGIGFIGAGTIIKLTDRIEVKGLTTASSIWLAAAVGTACGARSYELATIATVLAVIILVLFQRVERWLGLDGTEAEAGSAEEKAARKKGK